MKTTKVTCDGCGRDLSNTTNSDDKRLLLTVESVPNHSESSTAMYCPSPINRDKHFCGLSCIDKWRANGSP